MTYPRPGTLPASMAASTSSPPASPITMTSGAEVGNLATIMEDADSGGSNSDKENTATSVQPAHGGELRHSGENVATSRVILTNYAHRDDLTC